MIWKVPPTLPGEIAESYDSALNQFNIAHGDLEKDFGCTEARIVYGSADMNENHGQEPADLKMLPPLFRQWKDGMYLFHRTEVLGVLNPRLASHVYLRDNE